MTIDDLPSPTLSTAVVTGASRGFGRATSAALLAAGYRVVGVARDRDALAEAAADLGPGFVPVAADAADPIRTARLIDEHRPAVVVLNAGAIPLTRPLAQHTWESFSLPWETDVRQAFQWSREALLAPLAPGSTVLSVSSRAALTGGSPLTGGYSGAKATVRFVAGYAAQESERGGLGIRFLSLLPDLTPATRLGQVGVASYAARQGVPVETFLKERGPEMSAEQVGAAVRDLVTGTAANGAAYSITGAGMTVL